jgi:chromosome segregation ATPase
LLAEHAAAQQNLIDARNASAAALEQSAEYIEAQKRFAELDARVRELRQAGSSQAEVLAIASRERLEAQSLIGRLQKEHTANDTNLREAEQRLARAEKALADVYATLPTVQPQRQRLQELSAAVTDYSRSHENVLRQVSSFQKAIGEAEDKIARKERSVREMDRRINAIAVELEQLEKELRIMENNVPKLKQQFDAAHEREVRMYNAYLQAKKADDERTASGKKQ